MQRSVHVCGENESNVLFGGLKMKVSKILVLLFVLGFSVGSINAAVFDNILFGSNAGRESGDAPPGPYTSPHQLQHDGQGTIGTAVYMDRLYQNFDWVMAAPAGGGTCTLRTEFWSTANLTGNPTYGPGLSIYSDDIKPVYSGPYTTAYAYPNPAHSEYYDTATFDVTFDDPYIGVNRDWQPWGNPQVGFYNSTLTSDVTPLAAGTYDMVDFGNGTRLGQAASSTAHSLTSDGSVYADSVTMSTGLNITWDFTVSADGWYTPQARILDFDSAPGWGIGYFAYDVDLDGFENHEILDPIAVDTATAIKTFDDLYLTAGSHKFVILSAWGNGDNGYSVGYGAQLVLVPEPMTMLLLGSGALLALRRRRS